MKLAPGDSVVLADAHFDARTRSLDVFLAWLQWLQHAPIHALYILGDLFTIWIGGAKMRLPHQESVVNALCALRARGIRVIYVEGNRDYFLSPFYLGSPFHVIASESFRERIGPKWYFFAHGDLVNVHDTQYRFWRAFSKNSLIFALFSHLPRTAAINFSQYLERRFRETNAAHKTTFPGDVCQHYAETLWGQGNDVIVLGHFHEEHHLTPLSGEAGKHLHMLPAWKDGPRALRISQQGEGDYVQFTGA